MPTFLPCARRNDLLVENVLAETIVYDSFTHRVHCLNPTASAVWKHCDGKRGIEELAARVGAELSAPCDQSSIEIALQQLSEADLLVKPIKASRSRKELSRRDLLRHTRTAAILLPVVVSVLAPTPAMAVSCTPSGNPCPQPPGVCCTTCLGGVCI